MFSFLKAKRIAKKNEAKPSPSISPTSNRLVRINLFIMLEISSSQTPFYILDQRRFIYNKNEKRRNKDKTTKKQTTKANQKLQKKEKQKTKRT